MTQEEKQLLLKDLCARLPYGVIINKEVSRSYQIEELVDIGYGQRSDEVYINGYPLKKSRPYLRLMSSMTEDEINEYENFITNEKDDQLRFCNELVFYNSHHLDYRGLISRGLALKAPENMYKTK